METALQQNAKAQTSEDWRRSVAAMATDTARWAQEEGWSAVTDALPVVTLETPDGKLVLEPMPDTLDGRGRVKLYAWPTLYRVRLVQTDAGWEILTDSGVPLRQPWNKQTFLQLARDLLAVE